MTTIERFEALLAAGTDNEMLRYTLGSACFEAGEHARAIEHLRAAIEFKADYSAAWKILGRALSASGDLDDAADAFDRGICHRRGQWRQADRQGNHRVPSPPRQGPLQSVTLPPPPRDPATWPTWVAIGVLDLLARLPASFRRRIAGAVAALALRQESGQSRAIRINLEACYPQLSDSERRDFHRRYLQSVTEVLLRLPLAWWGNGDTLGRHTRYHGRKHLDAAIASGQPVILLVSHTVALEAGMIAMTRDYPMQGIYKPFNNRVIDWLALRARTRFGGRLAQRGRGFRHTLAALRDGVILSYFSDEDLGAEGTVFAPFFGHRKATLAMLPRLAQRTTAVVVPMASYYDAEADCFDIHLLPPLSDFPSGDLQTDLAAINQAIEATIHVFPEQYLWKLRLFRTCPDGGYSRYRQIEEGTLTAREL